MSWFATLYDKVKYFCQHYRLAIHLLLRTRAWGVNNKWTDGAIDRSIFGKNPLKQIAQVILVYPIVMNYRLIKWRMGKSVGFVPQKEYDYFFNRCER